jgi:primosomal protein N' (replication factor Y)
MVIHQSQNRIKCHHCGVEQAIPDRCDDCQRNELFALGQGTQRVESGLTELFPDIPISRIDRDSTRRKDALEQTLDAIHQGGAHILIGTQMLAKGHHFPDVTLVGILDVDAGLFSCDFRASERMAQQIVQVAGRAGRAEKPGRVLLQTHQPDHPFLESLLAHGYAEFARAALQERQQAGLPPYTFQALFRAEAVQESLAVEFLHAVRRALFDLHSPKVEILGPVPAPMLKRAGRYRQQLLLQSSERKSLHQLLASVRPQMESWPAARKVRWSLDIDPLDLF